MNWIYPQITQVPGFGGVAVAWIERDAEHFPLERLQFCLPWIRGSSQPSKLLRMGLERSLRMYTRRMVRFGLAEGAALLHAHFGTAGYYALSARERLDIPMITTFYGYDLSLYPRTYPRWLRRYERLFEVGELFVVEGNHMRQQLIALGCPPEKTVVQRIGVDLDAIRFSPRRLEAGDPFRLLIASTFTEKKGVVYGMRAFANLVAEHPAAELTLIGGGSTPEAQRIEAEADAIIEQHGLGSKVQKLGYVSRERLWEEARRAHIFLAPSVQAANGDNEGGAPVVITEMLASGMPVVSSHHCDIPEVVTDGESGLLAPERDVDTLTQHLLELATHPKRWPEMGRAGRRHVEQHYNLQLQMANLGDIYSQVLREM
jgi:colanic acid/amylovoran biosynthesis glycosyltransferase